MVLGDRGRRAEAQGWHEAALAIFRDVGDRGGEARTLSNLATLAQEAGEWATAETQYRQALAILDELGHVDAAAQIELAEEEA